MYLSSGYLVGASRAALGDVPTVDVNAGFLAPPPVSSVSLMQQTPNVFLVPRPQVAPLRGAGGLGLTFTPTTLALLAAGAVVVLLSSRRGR